MCLFVCVCVHVCACACVKTWRTSLIIAGAPHRPPDHSEFASSDYVRVELDTEIFEMLQQGHGGWNSAMSKV